MKPIDYFRFIAVIVVSYMFYLAAYGHVSGQDMGRSSFVAAFYVIIRAIRDNQEGDI